MTPLLQIITQYCYEYVDDIRLAEKRETDTALFAWEMWLLLRPAISLFKIPQEIQDYLLGENGENLVEPLFYSKQETVTEQTDELVISVPTGYELVSCRLEKQREDGYITYTPLNYDYNSETGELTVYISEAAVGTTIDIDMYKDGYFVNTLTRTMMNILGMCFQVVWTDRFNTDWLSNVSKVEDKSFFEQNRANKMRADTERLRELRSKLAGEMRRFETNISYKQFAPQTKKITF